MRAAVERPFVDTDVLLYLLSSDAAKADRAEALLVARIIISVQVLNEFASVASRKMGLGWSEIRQHLRDIRHFADVRPLDLQTHDLGMDLVQRYRLGLYDAMIAAAALEAECSVLLSEDFSAGQVFRSRLTVRNPFA